MSAQLIFHTLKPHYVPGNIERKEKGTEERKDHHDRSPIGLVRVTDITQ